MKPSDAQTLAAAARSAAELGAARAPEPLSVRAAGGIVDIAADEFRRALSNGLSGGPRGSELASKPEPVATSGSSDGQLLAAAHAVAAYWQSSQAALVQQASETVASGGQAVTIRVNHVTPEGGLAAVGLSHPDLGLLNLEISLSGRTLSVLATAETEHAAQAIRAGQAALAQRLQEQGITLQALDVVVLRRRAEARNAKSKRQES